MHKQRLSDEYTGVTLQSSDVDIRCHRNVLAAASDYFNALFRCDQGTTFYTSQVELPLLRPRSGDNLTSLFWNSGLVQIDCRCNIHGLFFIYL